MARIKGAGPKGFLTWVKNNHGEESLRKVLDGCSASTRSACKLIIVSAWYPIQIPDEVCAAYAELGLGGPGPNLDKSFRRSGLFIAEDNLSTLYKVALGFVTPNTMLGLLPRMWKTYFDGINVEVQAGSDGPYTGTCRVKGLGNFRYISPIAAGWIEFAYKRVGATYIYIHELNYTRESPSNDELIYKIRWK